jgi:hypothetical protein
MDAYRKVQPGQPLDISAKAWNALMDSLQTNRGFVAAPDGIEMARNIVLIKNISGHDVERFHVLGINGVAIEPATGATGKTNDFARRPILTGVTPTSEHADKFVVMLEPARNDAVGQAAIGGVFACKVELTKIGHKYAKAKPGDRTQLESTNKCSPIRLVWVEGGPTGATGATGPSGSTGPQKWAVGVM